MTEHDAAQVEASEPRLTAFVSYAREDVEFVDRLERRLQARSIKCLIDRSHIEKLEDWWERIRALIGEADAVIFVLSSDALDSDWPRREVEYAASLNKRLAPVAVADVPARRVPEALARLNYVYMRPTDDEDRAVADLVTALVTDLDWVREHTRLGQAAQRWSKTEKSEPARGDALLLRGPELAGAELWISSRPREAPEPTNLHRSFIQQSRRAEQARIKRDKKQVAARQRLVLCLLAVSIAAAGYAAWQSRETDKREAKIMTSLAHRAMAEGHYDRAMRVALRGLPPTDALPLAFWSAEVEAKLAGAALLSRLRAQMIHGGAVATAVFSPDGRRIVTASEDRTARVWDADGAKQLELNDHTDEVRSAAFSHDGERIVTASKDESARLWDAKSGRATAVLKGHQGTVVSAAFSPDDRFIVTASYDSTARIWDGVTGAMLRQLSEHTDEVWSATFSRDGRHIVTGSKDGDARVWEVESGKQVLRLQGHRGSVRDASFSPDGSRIVTASYDRTARLWDARDGREIATLPGHEHWVWSAQFALGGQRIVTISKDGTARLWDANDGALLEFMRGHAEPLRGVAVSPDGRRIATASTDKTVRIWDAQTGKETAALVGHSDYVRNVAFSPDGKRVLTASDDGTARVWDSERGVLVLRGHESGVRSVSFEPDGKRIVSVSDTDARLWDADSGQALGASEPAQDLDTRSIPIVQTWSSPDGRRRVKEGKPARLLDASGALVAELHGHEGRILHAAFGEDGRLFATASADDTARVWEAATGKRLGELKGHRKHVRGVAFSPDGRHVATASEDGTARLWHVASSTEIAELSGHTRGVHRVAFSPDGRRLVTGSDDRTVRVWDVGWVTTLTGDDLRNRVCLHKLVGARVMTRGDAQDPILATDNGTNVCDRRGAMKGLWTAWRHVSTWTGH
jgi:WD40 repeat protein